MIESLNARIRDRLSQEWLTSSQRDVWQAIRSFDGPTHRVINVYGAEGTGKTFLGWLLEREQYSSYGLWSETPKPVLPRLTLDDAIQDRSETRAKRPLVEKLGIRQIILLSRSRVDEPDMPAFELRVTQDDLERFRANLYRYLGEVLPEGNFRNYKSAVEVLR